MGALVIAIVAVGIYPAIVTDIIESGVAPIATIVEAAS
jgi:NADH:ubiquinone oxidoreductase subunit 4 (subunit M)